MKALLPLCLILLAAPAWASRTCTFDQECLEGEACEDSGYTLALTDSQIEDDSGPIPVTPLAGDGPDTAYGGRSTAGSHLLTIAADGNARYSVHFAGAGFSMLYLGTCTEAQ